MRILIAISLLLVAGCSAAPDSSSADYSSDAAADEVPASDTAVAADDYSTDADTGSADHGDAMADDASATADDAGETQLPEFPLPAPRPSVRANLPRSLFGNPKTVGDIASSLSKALDASGYDDVSYYRVPGGFALITETERIHDDGSPYTGAARWMFQPAPLLSIGTLFSNGFPGGFLDQLRRADPGRYRVLVFLVTTKVVTSGNAPVTFETAQTWTSGGGDFLPASIARIRLTPNHNSSVLIYEFRRTSVAAAPSYIDPSGITARQHLTASHLLRGP